MNIQKSTAFLNIWKTPNKISKGGVHMIYKTFKQKVVKHK